MIPILYEANERFFSTNGLGRLRDTISAVVTEERNSIYELDFQYPVNGAHFDEIIPGRIVAVTHDESGTIEPFDIVGFTKPIDGIVEFHCVHISYRLAGQVVWASNINSLASALNVFAGVSGTPFTYSADFTSSAYMAAFDGTPRTVRQLIGGIEGSILDTYGGELEWRGFNVYLHKARGVLRDFTIRYGVNLADYTDETDFQGTYTSCIPYWMGQDGDADVIVRGARVNSGLNPYNGRNDCIPLDLSDKFETKPTAAQLETLARTIMTGNAVNLPNQTIKVDFIRIQDSPEFAQMATLMQCNLCDSIKVIFPMYNMEGTFKIVRTVWNVLLDKYDSMELGNLSTTLAEALGVPQETANSFNEGGGGAISDVQMNGASIVRDGVAYVTNAAGNMALTGSLTFNNAKNITMKDTGGTARAVLSMSASNNTVLGYGGYDASQGGTNIYGNTIRLYSNNAIQSNAQYAGLYKITTVSISVAGINAHGYVSGSGHSMTAQSGYNAVGIVGWDTSNYRIRPTSHYISSNTSLFSGFANTSANNVTSTTTINFRVLWLKATSG